MPHAARAKLLFDLADLIEARADEIALLETLDNGKPFRDARSVDIPSAVEDVPLVRRLGDEIVGEALASRAATSTPTACASRSAWPG